MSTDIRRSYLESDIAEADGCKLVVLLYQAALESVAKAREHLARGEIAARVRAITRTSEILNELALSVDHEAGGELSRNLVELYAYLQLLLQKANAEQADPPLEEAESLLRTLLEAWEQAAAATRESLLPADALATASAAERPPLDCLG